jgi:HD-GYP domain-containing protein (c-di-GMP phosphodiesterase class II)
MQWYNSSIINIFEQNIGEFTYIWLALGLLLVGDTMLNQKLAEGNLATLLCALSFATGVGFGGHIEHGLGSASLGLQIADALGLSEEDREAIFYSAFLKDVACTACSAGIAAFFPDDEQVSLSDVILMDPSRMGEMISWLSRYFRLDAHFPRRITKLLSFLAQCGPIVKETMRSHCEIAELFARRLGFPVHVQQTLRFQWERWDGRGMAYGLKGTAIPRAARILHFAQVLDLTYRFAGTPATVQLAEERRGNRFDPEAVDAFLALARRPDFWPTFEQQLAEEALLAHPPATQADQMPGDQVELICEVLAEFVDLKTRETWHHSEAVAEVAQIIGARLGLSPDELTSLRRAAFVHDIGKVAIPIAILSKGDARTNNEWETYRLHPYYTQRILERVKALHDLARAAASHHEWVNGQGYHRQLAGEQIPLHGRILAVANSYARLIQQLQPPEALRQMSPLVDRQFDRACYEALVASVMGKSRLPGQRLRSAQTGGLTAREIEVLRLLARGYNTPHIARTLQISKKTVEHHLRHIYAKIDVTCRTAAVVYAVQHHLV